MAARSRFVRRRSGVSAGHFLVGMSGPFPEADLPRVCATRGGAVRDGLAEGEVLYPVRNHRKRPPCHV